MFRALLTGLGLLTLAAGVGLASLLGTHTNPTFQEGWCAGFAEAERDAQSRGYPTSKRVIRQDRGFTVRLDDDRSILCEWE